MKMLFFCFIFFNASFYSANAQDKPFCIKTEIGMMKVSQTGDGNDMITMSIASWDELVAGTKFSSYYLSPRAKKCCIEIADKKQGLCKRGIGFGCSIFDWLYVPGQLPNQVNDENRICAVTLRKLRNLIQIIFIDHVDWESLSK